MLCMHGSSCCVSHAPPSLRPCKNKVYQEIIHSHGTFHLGAAIGATVHRLEQPQPARGLRHRFGQRPDDWQRLHPAARAAACRNHGAARCGQPGRIARGQHGVRHAGALLALRPHPALLRRPDQRRRCQSGGGLARPQPARIGQRHGAAAHSGHRSGTARARF